MCSNHTVSASTTQKINRSNDGLLNQIIYDKINERINAVGRSMNLWYSPTAENVEATSESATTETDNQQTTAADSELTTVTDEVTDSQTQTQTGKLDRRFT